MFDLIKTYPLLTVFIIGFVALLIKNHILATPLDIKEAKKALIKELKEGEIFVTHDELNKMKETIRSDYEARFLSLAVFSKFKEGLDNQFKTVFQKFDENKEQFSELFRGINDIKNILIRNNKE